MAGKSQRLARGGLMAALGVVLAGCDQPASTPPRAAVAPPAVRATSESQAPGGSGVRPAAEAVGSAAPAAAGARDRGREDAPGAMTKEQESQSMPLGGQANNYNSPNDTYRAPTPPSKE